MRNERMIAAEKSRQKTADLYYKVFNTAAGEQLLELWRNSILSVKVMVNGVAIDRRDHPNIAWLDSQETFIRYVLEVFNNKKKELQG